MGWSRSSISSSKWAEPTANFMKYFASFQPGFLKSLFLALLVSVPPIRAFAATPSEEFIQAIVKGNEKKALALLEQGADPNARDIFTQPAMATAAYFRREKTLVALLAHGADFRAVDNDGLNALHAAAVGGSAEVARRLIDQGLPVNLRGGTDGMTALANAAVRGHLKVMRLLIKRGADVNIPDSGGNTPLLHAAMRDRTDAVRLLLEHGANVDAASKQGWTPLMAAAWEGHTSIVKDLLKRGANANLMNREHRSALMLAESEGHGKVVKLLKAAAR